MIIFTLVAHVILGLIGIMGSFMAVIALGGRTVKLTKLKIASVSAFVFYVLSWLTGGYYYVIHYGGAVKPVINAGAYPWAHAIVTETKEHVFLFLPVLTFLLAYLAFKRGRALETDPKLRKATTALAFIIFLIGLGIAAAGVAISGAVR